MNVNETQCAEKNEAYDDARFALVVYIGTPIALTGIAFNGILLVMFCNKRSIHSYKFFLLILAILDMLICVLYIPFFTVDALALYYSIQSLHELWHTYAMFLYGMSRLVQFSAVYMMLCATLERLIYVSGIRLLHHLITLLGKISLISIVFILAVLLRAPTFFDYEITYNANCPPFQDYLFVPVLMASEWYGKYNFIMMSIVQTIVPFILLTVFNILIILLTRKRLFQTASGRPFVELPRISSMMRKASASRKDRDELKYATWTMVAIVFTYLCCNVFSVFMIVIENLFPESVLLYNKDGSSTKFYTITADLISILVALNSVLRLAVYFSCNPQFRTEFIQLLFASSSNAASNDMNNPAQLSKNDSTTNGSTEFSKMHFLVVKSANGSMQATDV